MRQTDAAERRTKPPMPAQQRHFMASTPDKRIVVFRTSRSFDYRSAWIQFVRHMGGGVGMRAFGFSSKPPGEAPVPPNRTDGRGVAYAQSVSLRAVEITLSEIQALRAESATMHQAQGRVPATLGVAHSFIIRGPREGRTHG